MSGLGEVKITGGPKSFDVRELFVPVLVYPPGAATRSCTCQSLGVCSVHAAMYVEGSRGTRHEYFILAPPRALFGNGGPW